MNEASHRLRPGTIVLPAISAVLFVAATSMAGDPADKCEAGKLSMAAKYGSCRLKADSKVVKGGGSLPGDYSKCSLAKFEDAEGKATAAMSSCPTNDDEAMVTAYLDDCTSRVATWLGGGGGLPDTCEEDLAACESQAFARPLVTGQLDCWSGSTLAPCAGTGQDGDVRAGVARSFTDNGDGTLTDDATGLMWEKLSDDGSIHDKDNTYTWANAFSVKIATLNSMSFAGYDDWRLPNRFELETLLDLQESDPMVHPAFKSPCTPGCDGTACSCSDTSDYYWSSTTVQTQHSDAWILETLDADWEKGLKTNSRWVRAVR